MAVSSAGCESCGNTPPEGTTATTAVVVPRDFAGTWQLTIQDRTAPVTLRLWPSRNQTSPGELIFEGLWEQNAQVNGSATGDEFAGTVVVGTSNAYGIQMRLMPGGQAAGTFTSAMNPSPFVAVRMGP